MLDEWTIGNFKAVSKTLNLKMAPLTVFAGVNSSGKSTILQSILLFAQTLRATASQKPLILNGEFVRLGYMTDVLHYGREHLPLDIGFKLSLHKNKLIQGSTSNNGEQISLHATFKLMPSKSDELGEEVLQDLDLTQGDTNIHLERAFDRSDVMEFHPEFPALQMSSALRKEVQRGFYGYNVFQLHFPEVRMEGKWFKQIRPFRLQASLYHFLPGEILETYDARTTALVLAMQTVAKIFSVRREKRSRGNVDIEVEIEKLALLPVNNFKKPLGEQIRLEISKALRNGIRTSRDFEMIRYSSIPNAVEMSEAYLRQASSLEAWVLRMLKDVPEPNLRTIAEYLYIGASQLERTENQDCDYDDIGVRTSDLPPSLASVRSAIIDYFSNRVYYLGPLRDDPHFIYSLPPYPEVTHVGLKGEYTASVLERFKTQVIEYPIPPKQDGLPMKVGNAPLLEALEEWLRYMKLLDNVKTKDRGKVGTELTVRHPGVDRDLDLTSIGVGVSQVLPTMVMGLIAPPGTTFLFEQPELHLHPQMQCAIGDFLLGLSLIGKQCIVETHSEYMLTRLRRRVAEDETSKLFNDVQIYFVEREKGISEFRKLDLNEFGSVLDWPAGFFDQGPNEAQLILQASLKKRRENRVNKKM